MIRLVDFLPVPDQAKTKLKFNMRTGDHRRAWDLLLADDPDWINMNQWRTRQANNNLDRAKHLLAFAQYYPYGPEYFIFGGMYRVRTKEPAIYDADGYELELMDIHAEYIKRLIVKLDKPIGQNNYLRRYRTVQEQLQPEVYELAPYTKLGPFPGYNSVSLTHRELQHIVNNDEPSWKQALSNVKAVYVITDTSDGKLYIGSASSNAQGLWQRWANYAHLSMLTGGNRELEELRVLRGAEHIRENFRYTILEIFDTKTKQETILERESYWKNALDSRAHGLNRN